MNKAFFILFFCFFIQHPLYSQNLIYNGDFEIYDTCPTNFSQPLDYQIEHATGWYAPTMGTSDYFNVCNPGIVSVPFNFAGEQAAYSGNAYTGLFANDRGFSIGQCFDGQRSFFYREYIQTKLTNQLEEGKIYKLTFYVSLAELGGYTIKNIGVLFSNDSILTNCFKPIIANPQIKSPNFITDSLSWTKIEGYFQAQGNELFLTLGNFRDTSEYEFDTLCVNPGTEWQFGDGLCYYYIDGLELIESEITIPNVFSPNSDEINDFFILNFAFEQVEIFNRWGQRIFETTNNEIFWNGNTMNEEKCPAGTYYYIIKFQELEFKGFVHLMR